MQGQENPCITVPPFRIRIVTIFCIVGRVINTGGRIANGNNNNINTGGYNVIESGGNTDNGQGNTIETTGNRITGGGGLGSNFINSGGNAGNAAYGTAWYVSTELFILQGLESTTEVSLSTLIRLKVYIDLWLMYTCTAVN